MFSNSFIDQSLLQSYLETEYYVHSNISVTLKIGAASPQLAALHRTYQAESSAFITAFNPFSQTLDETGNAKRQTALLIGLQQRSLSYIGAIGQHPTNGWPGEPSFLVLGLCRAEAMLLGSQYEQNAIVWCNRDAVPELVLLR